MNQTDWSLWDECKLITAVAFFLIFPLALIMTPMYFSSKYHRCIDFHTERLTIQGYEISSVRRTISGHYWLGRASRADDKIVFTCKRGKFESFREGQRQ